MPNSSTGGYLQPLTSPLIGQDFQRLLQQAVVGITGLPGNMVRPRWQAEPANIPTEGIAWAAVGISSRRALGTTEQLFAPDGSFQLVRTEELTLLTSFYDTGVTQQADKYAETLRDGITLNQNQELLVAAGLGLRSVGDLTPAPIPTKRLWLYRVDLPIRFYRQMVWTYPVLQVQQAVVQIQTETQAGVLVSDTFTIDLT